MHHQRGEKYRQLKPKAAIDIKGIAKKKAMAWVSLPVSSG